jgi:hypothetical protein
MTMATLMQASRQWATRPDDQRFASLTDLHAHCENVRRSSKASVVSSRKLTVVPLDTDGGTDLDRKQADTKSLAIIGPSGHAAAPTNWAFQQLASLAGAPAGYLRTLPSPLAADNLNFGLKIARDVEDVGVLLYKNGGPAQVTAATGPRYGRVWNSDVTGALVKRFGDGLSGQFRVPGEFGKAVDITKKNTTLFASDRDMFVFLADEGRRITVKDRRSGKSGSLARGFFVWNSEVGKCTLGIGMFLFDYVCCNRIVWGAEGYQEIKINHTASAPDKFVEQLLPAVKAYSEASAEPVRLAIAAAQRKRIGDEDAVLEFLAKRFTRPQAKAIQAAHVVDEGRPIESIWDAATGATAYARGIMNTDTRLDIEREAGRIIDMVK